MTMDVVKCMYIFAGNNLEMKSISLILLVIGLGTLIGCEPAAVETVRESLQGRELVAAPANHFEMKPYFGAVKSAVFQGQVENYQDRSSDMFTERYEYSNAEMIASLVSVGIEVPEGEYAQTYINAMQLEYELGDFTAMDTVYTTKVNGLPCLIAMVEEEGVLYEMGVRRRMPIKSLHAYFVGQDWTCVLVSGIVVNKYNDAIGRKMMSCVTSMKEL